MNQCITKIKTKISVEGKGFQGHVKFVMVYYRQWTMTFVLKNSPLRKVVDHDKTERYWINKIRRSKAADFRHGRLGD